MIWIPNETESWEAATIVNADTGNNSITVRSFKTNKEYKISGNIASFDPVSISALEENCENLVDLESFCEGIILHHIRTRFANNNIYTFVGNILIAVNPYKSLDIYGLQLIDKIYSSTKRNESTSPHVFSIGACAVNNMKNDGRDQSVLISGESGAGKTEATKKILQFISTVCGSTASRTGVSIENQILDSNPLLESFGNAKTIRNNNSSRFGKYMEVNFDKKNNIKGCNIVSYLLEKSRVVKQGPNERNYHIFYMFLSGATKDMKRDFSLKPVDQFYYLMQSGCVEVDRRSDVKEFEEMMQAMHSLGIDQTTQTNIFSCLAAILHLGNILFAPINARDSDSGSKITIPADCRKVATLLGISPEGLETALCFKDSVINGESLLIPLTPEKATDQRDSLAKHVYGKMFDHIVNRVNSSLFRGKGGMNIGVLDIFGFEVFKLNSFEQLCINYCNERLQTFFNEVIFEGEMKLYAAEELPCDDIMFEDNIGCVRLIDQKNAGIFAFLDEESIVPKGSDEKFVSKINQIFDENNATKSQYFGRNRRSVLDFTIMHFAGDVVYNAVDFLEKNRDTMSESLVAQLEQSTVNFLKNNAEAETNKSNSKKGNKLTLCAKFKNDLDNLMTTLRSTAPHFIRCIKPNNEQSPNKFESNLALNQLKYSGLFDAIRIRKSGYAIRIPHDQFIRRYRVCSSVSYPKNIQNNQFLFCETLLNEFTKVIPDVSTISSTKNIKNKTAVPPPTTTTILRKWIIGKTKVFIRTQEFKYQLEVLRSQSTVNAIIPIQRLVRGFVARSKLSHMLGENKSKFEKMKARESIEKELMSQEDDLSKQIEELYKQDYALQKKLAEARAQRYRDEKKRMILIRDKSAVKIQALIRGKIGRKYGRIKMCEMILEKALLSRSEEEIRKALVMPKMMGVSSKLIRLYVTHAKPLILEVMHEAYISNQLEEAIIIGTHSMILDAIKQAETAKMTYLPKYAEAKATIDRKALLKSTLTNLKEILSKCVTVPKLLANVDNLQALLVQATSLGLSSESIVQETWLRINKINNLIKLRDKFRFAVEICSPSRMN
eukprot:gene15212-20491_t